MLHHPTGQVIQVENHLPLGSFVCLVHGLQCLDDCLRIRNYPYLRGLSIGDSIQLAFKLGFASLGLLKRLGPVCQFTGMLTGSFVMGAFALLGFLPKSLLLLVQSSLLLLIA